jgi:hypothetical protein
VNALNASQTNDYFWFAFVRNPVSRFPSSYAQANVGQRRIPAMITKEHALGVLRRMAELALVPDIHLQTQVHSLSSLTASGNMLALRFIGRVESLSADWTALLSALQQRLPPSLADSFPLSRAAKLDYVHHTSQDVFLQRIEAFRDDVEIERAVVET